MKYDLSCIQRRDDDTCRYSCNECSKNCPFYDTGLFLEFGEVLEEHSGQDYQESEFAVGVEYQKERAIEAVKIIIDSI